MNAVRTALLHYWLTNLRGGEKVLASMAEMFPAADVFTHALGAAMKDPVKSGEADMRWRGHVVRESFVARLPAGRKWPQAYLPLMPVASRRLNLEGYDLILSSESGPIKGIRKPMGARHVCYCHTPMRYVWDLYDEYYSAAGTAGKLAMRLFTPFLRRMDLRSAESVDTFVANSRFVADRIKRIYGRESVVIHPPVDVDFFGDEQVGEKKDYYLYAGELRAYKRPDLAVRACLKMGRKLVVVGNGKLRESLERLTGGNASVTFLGRVSDDRLRRIYGEARALLFPGVEDFGIVPVEAQAAGTPVIAFGQGGALETVNAFETGLFFHAPSVDSLCGAIAEFENTSWRRDACVANAKRFGSEVFKSALRDVIARVF